MRLIFASTAKNWKCLFREIHSQVEFESAILDLTDLTERCLYAGWRKGNLADARAGSVENRVSNCGGYQRDRELSRSCCYFLWPVNDRDLNLGNGEAEGQGPVGGPAGRTK